MTTSNVIMFPHQKVRAPKANGMSDGSASQSALSRSALDKKKEKAEAVLQQTINSVIQVMHKNRVETGPSEDEFWLTIICLRGAIYKAYGLDYSLQEVLDSMVLDFRKFLEEVEGEENDGGSDDGGTKNT